MYLRLSKVVPLLGVSRRVVYYWARHGLLPEVLQHRLLTMGGMPAAAHVGEFGIGNQLSLSDGARVL